MPTFNETRVPTSTKYVAEQGIVMPNWLKTCQTFWLHSSVFALEKQPQNLSFHSAFTSKRPFGGYFQWNACTYFHKICSWTRYSDAKLIKNIWHFLVTLFRFCFRKITSKYKFSMFLPLRDTLVATFNETRAPTSRKYVAEQGIVMPNWSKRCQTFWLHSSVLALEKQLKNLSF